MPLDKNSDGKRTKRDRQKKKKMKKRTEAMPAWTSPGLTMSTSGVEKPGHSDEKWATGIGRLKWTRNENRKLLACYYACSSSEIGM